MVILYIDADRLDSPLPLVREMSKRLALAFSLAINPAKPLLLDDEDQVKDLDDWDYLSLKAVVGSKEKHHTGTVQSNQVVLASTEGDMDSSKLLADRAPVTSSLGKFILSFWMEDL